ncbi:MAG: type II toxin-antitoxin system HicA family toxin [Lachnospiraceae bacterium]|nr:type II toxin-antitoxin system HicA family toxin [Lachnospiraceae bacterium]
MADYTGAVIDKLKQNGCIFVRHGKGDHNIWYSPATNRNFTVDSKIKSRFTVNAIMKQAGINYHF